MSVPNFNSFGVTPAANKHKAARRIEPDNQGSSVTSERPGTPQVALTENHRKRQPFSWAYRKHSK